MINFEVFANENKRDYNLKWSYILDHPYRILIITGSGSGKTNALLSLMNKQPGIDKIYLYAKDPYEAKYQTLIDKRESVGLKHFNDPKVFIEYSNDKQDVQKNTDEYNPGKKRKILIAFDGKIDDMINNKKLNSIVAQLFITGRKLNISLVFNTQSYFKVSFVVVKILNKRELQQITLNHSSDIDFEGFIKIYK